MSSKRQRRDDNKNSCDASLPQRCVQPLLDVTFGMIPLMASNAVVGPARDTTTTANGILPTKAPLWQAAERAHIMHHVLVTPFGLTCSMCGHHIGCSYSAFRRHFTKQHNVPVKEEQFRPIKEKHELLSAKIGSGMEAVEPYLTSTTVKGFSCDRVTGFQRFSNAKRHLDSKYVSCGRGNNMEPRPEELRVSICGRLISQRAIHEKTRMSSCSKIATTTVEDLGNDTDNEVVKHDEDRKTTRQEERLCQTSEAVPFLRNVLVTPFGMTCSLCNEKIGCGYNSIRRHFEKRHDIDVTEDDFRHLDEKYKSLSKMQCLDMDTLQQRFLTSETVRGYSCNCLTGYTKLSNAKRHLASRNVSCGAVSPRSEELRVSTCGRLVSLRAVLARLGTSSFEPTISNNEETTTRGAAAAARDAVDDENVSQCSGVAPAIHDETAINQTMTTRTTTTTPPLCQPTEHIQLLRSVLVTPFGITCSLCHKQISCSYTTVRRHFAKDHDAVVADEDFRRLEEKYESLSKIDGLKMRSDALEQYFTSATVQGFSCNCITGFTRFCNAKRHVESKAATCGATEARAEKLRVSTCGRLISMRAVRAKMMKTTQAPHLCKETTGADDNVQQIAHTGIVQVTPFGMTCTLCNGHLWSSYNAFQRHFDKYHNILVTEEEFQPLLEKYESLSKIQGFAGMEALEQYLTPRTVKGYSCNCITGCNKYSNAKRHLMSSKACGTKKPRAEELRVSICGRLISPSAVLAKLGTSSSKNPSLLGGKRSRRAISTKVIDDDYVSRATSTESASSTGSYDGRNEDVSDSYFGQDETGEQEEESSLMDHVDLDSGPAHQRTDTRIKNHKNASCTAAVEEESEEEIRTDEYSLLVDFELSEKRQSSFRLDEGSVSWSSELKQQPCWEGVMTSGPDDGDIRANEEVIEHNQYDLVDLEELLEQVQSGKSGGGQVRLSRNGRKRRRSAAEISPDHHHNDDMATEEEEEVTPPDEMLVVFPEEYTILF